MGVKPKKSQEKLCKNHVALNGELRQICLDWNSSVMLQDLSSFDINQQLY